MAYARIPRGHTEFGGGPGLIDPERRRDRVVSAEEQLWEIYATDPSDPAADVSTSDIKNWTRRPRKVDPTTAAGTT